MSTKMSISSDMHLCVNVYACGSIARAIGGTCRQLRSVEYATTV